MKRTPCQLQFDQGRADPEGGSTFDTPLLAAGHLAIRRAGSGNGLLHSVKRGAVSQRPDQRRRDQGEPDGGQGPGLAQPGKQCPCDALLHKEPSGFGSRRPMLRPGSRTGLPRRRAGTRRQMRKAAYGQVIASLAGV